MRTTASGSTAQDYPLPNDWRLARERLALLEACHDPATFRRSQALGVRPGWSCLDASAGHGSVARWLAQRVGPGGRVVAADLDVTGSGRPRRCPAPRPSKPTAERVNVRRSPYER